MLQVTIPEREFYDEKRQEFVTTQSVSLQLEHSLVSLSKWESKWCKPFLGKGERTNEEVMDYIRCMTITKNVDQNVYNYIPAPVINQIKDYINAPMTATWINERETLPKKGGIEVVTAEVIYYWMIALNVPMECQKWHLNRLITLIRVCNISNQPPKPVNRKEMISRRRALNEARRSQLNTKG